MLFTKGKHTEKKPTQKKVFNPRGLVAPFKIQKLDISALGAIFILRKDIGVGGQKMAIFPYFTYVVKMSLRRWGGGSEKSQNTLT